jgi:cytochrome c oxidase subunit 3
MHKIYLVDRSFWPLILSLWLVSLTGSFVAIFRGAEYLLPFMLRLVCYIWRRDIVREGSYIGRHISTVSNSILLSMKMFIFSEVIFFSGFFRSLFYTMFIREVEVGITFPPIGSTRLDPLGIPLLNTVLLLSSRVTVTWGHGGLSGRSNEDLANGLLISSLLGVVFIFCQYIEYCNSDFTISSRIYACNFFALTGFHRFHVTVGMLGLLLCWGRVIIGNVYFRKGVGCDCFIWYWHFVDVVWLFLFRVVYGLVYLL